ncbi:MAG: HNH endonuclease [Leptolyngbyaceae cyanobacterium]
MISSAGFRPSTQPTAIGDRADLADATAANGGVKSPGTTCHHHQNGTIIQAVNARIHQRFRHRGGVSIKKRGN